MGPEPVGQAMPPIAAQFSTVLEAKLETIDRDFTHTSVVRRACLRVCVRACCACRVCGPVRVCVCLCVCYECVCSV